MFAGTRRGYATQWYKSAKDAASATPVPVQVGATTSVIDAALVKVGRVFGDVPASSPFAADIEMVSRLKVAAGVGGGLFDPSGVVSRWQMALFLSRSWTAAGLQLPAGTAPFDDVKSLPADYQAAIGSLVALGITDGTSASTFSPDANVTRWQMAVFLVRLLRSSGLVSLPDGASQGFGDLGELAPEFQTAINQLAQLGITKGTSVSTFDPDAVVTREQMAAFLARMLRLLGLN